MAKKAEGSRVASITAGDFLEKSDPSKYRVFISYSHKDKWLANEIAKVLMENHLDPVWDEYFRIGQGFHDQIKNAIAHAHVFLPVLTVTADKRKWVHQEIGYAMAMNIPVIPVAAGKLPGEMLQQIHAVNIGENMEKLRIASLKEHLSNEMIKNLVLRYSDMRFATFQCAEFPEDRATMMAEYCNEVRLLGRTGEILQKGGLSSFHIPRNTIGNKAWRERYGTTKRSKLHCRLQREERLALEHHARQSGCKLIINPDLTFEKYGERAREVRLQCLLEFLESMTDEKCQVAISKQVVEAGRDKSKSDANQVEDSYSQESVTILGDWFFAESVSAKIGEGYRQTNFTRHAPTVSSKVELFHQEFEERLEERKWTSLESRKKVIELIEEKLRVIAGR